MNKKECQLVGMLKAERNYLSEIQKQYLAELPKLPEGYLCCVRKISLLDQIIKGYLPYDPDEICQSGRPAYLSELLPISKVEVRT